MEYLSSMYIDDEMNLPEKHLFIKNIREDEQFYILTRDLIEQEQALRSHLSPSRPAFKLRLPAVMKPLGYALCGAILAVSISFFGFQPHRAGNPDLSMSRFVIYQPNASQVELTGSFNEWQKISLNPIGKSGYWEVRIPLASGEYRFAYILDGDKRIIDPTLPGREQDDFGGENSILNIETSI